MIKVVVTLLILFVVLTPGILWSYAKKTDKYFIALVHAAIFAFVWSFIQPRINNTTFREGLTENDKITFSYVTNSKLYTTANRKKHKLFKNVYVRKSVDKTDRIITVLRGKERYLEITQADFDDNMARAMEDNAIKAFKI